MKAILQNVLAQVNLTTLRLSRLDRAFTAEAQRLAERISEDLSANQAVSLCDQLRAAERDNERIAALTLKEFAHLEAADKALQRWLPFAILGVTQQLVAISRLRRERLALVDAIQLPEAKEAAID